VISRPFVGIEYKPTVTRSVAGIAFFTGKINGDSHAVSLYSDAGDKPGVPLVGPASFAPDSVKIDWYDGRFDPPFEVQAGTTYWIVWSPVDNAPCSFTGASVDKARYRASDDGFTWDTIYTGGPMVRVECLAP